MRSRARRNRRAGRPGRWASRPSVAGSPGAHAAVGLPQSPARGIAAVAGVTVVEGGKWTVVKTAFELKSAQRASFVRNTPARQVAPQEPGQRQDESGEQDNVQPTGQPQPQAEQCEAGEDRYQRCAAPQARPQILPGEGPPGPSGSAAAPSKAGRWPTRVRLVRSCHASFVGRRRLHPTGQAVQGHGFFICRASAHRGKITTAYHDFGHQAPPIVA